MNRAPAFLRPGRFSLAAVFALALSLGCSSSGGVDSGPPPTAQEYFNFPDAGQCFSYTTGDAGRPSRGLLIQPVSVPPGVSITTLHHGATEQVEYLTFDGGVAFLNQRNVFPTASSDAGIDNRLFTTPLTYLVAPLVDGQSNLQSSSDYTGTSTGTESFTVSILGQSFTWNGIGADAGGSPAFPLQFSGEDDGGGGLTQNKTMLPWVGFVQLNATDDTGSFVTFTLTGIAPYNAGTACGD
jgi:hypothetical protein